jgi:hypothetical protein
MGATLYSPGSKNILHEYGRERPGSSLHRFIAHSLRVSAVWRGGPAG